MTRATTAAPLPSDELTSRLNALGMRGVVEHLDEFQDAKWLSRLIEIEEADRAQRGLERRLRNAKIGRFTPLFQLALAPLIRLALFS